MIRRSYRLSARQLSEIMEKGKIYHSTLFTMRLMSSLSDKGLQVAAVAPQKSFKTAVSRNRMRRRAYEIVRKIIPTMSADKTLVLFAKSGAAEATPSALEADIRGLFVKAGVLR